MIHKMNELMLQQTQRPIGEIASSELDWDNALYFFISDPDPRRELGLFCGFEIFPNRAIRRATYHLRHRGEQYRGMSIQPLEDDIGTILESEYFRFECLDPMSSWKISIHDEEKGVGVDLDYRARCPAYAFPHVRLPGSYEGAIDQRHYTQSGRFAGSVTVGGETSHALVGMKNRSWGVRNWNRLPMYHWLTAQFGDFSVNTWLFEDQQGQPLFADGAVTAEGGSITRIVSVEQALELHEGSTKRVKARHLTLTTEEGEKLELEGREIGSIPLAVLPDRFSDANPEEFAAAEKAALWFEQHTSFALGDQHGIGFVEHCVAPGCQRHGIEPTPFPYFDPGDPAAADDR